MWENLKKLEDNFEIKQILKTLKSFNFLTKFQKLLRKYFWKFLELWNKFLESYRKCEKFGKNFKFLSKAYSSKNSFNYKECGTILSLLWLNLKLSLKVGTESTTPSAAPSAAFVIKQEMH